MPDPFYQLHWQQLHDSRLSQTQTELWICQLQCAVPAIAGNKWLKLKYHIQQIQQHNKAGILTFGGAFSNHLAAVAAAGQHFGFETHAIVRCHQPDLASPTLKQCQAQGMKLMFVSPEQYRQRHHPEWQAHLQQQYPKLLLVPEGGSSDLALHGVAELPLAQTPAGPATLLCTATASGGTLAGLIIGQPSLPVLGIAVVKDQNLVTKTTHLLQSAGITTPTSPLWQIWPDVSGKAYGKFCEQTRQTCLQLAKQGVATEPIYTGKALHSVLQWVAEGRIPQGQRLAFFHSGGLQGLAGLFYRGLLNAAEYAQLRAAIPAWEVIVPTVD